MYVAHSLQTNKTQFTIDVDTVNTIELKDIVITIQSTKSVTRKKLDISNNIFVIFCYTFLVILFVVFLINLKENRSLR